MKKMKNSDGSECYVGWEGWRSVAVVGNGGCGCGWGWVWEWDVGGGEVGGGGEEGGGGKDDDVLLGRFDPRVKPQD